MIDPRTNRINVLLHKYEVARRMNNLIQGYIVSIDNDLSVGNNTSDVINIDKKRSGPSTDPRGTPDTTGNAGDL